jgi:hypothetical protein
MAEKIVSQLTFGFQPKLRIDFEGGTITSDAGLTLIREFDHGLGLTADVASRITDDRDQRYVTHDMLTLVRQRSYQIVAGYEDANDADRLKDDPTFQAVASESSEVLGSQPTISRLENDIDWSSIARLSKVGLDWFCQHAFGERTQPKELILDLDSTDDPTHGQQQFALFHGGYNQHMYHPLCWFEGNTGLLLKTRLRPGLDRSASFVVEDLKQIVPPLRNRFPKSRLRLRADAGMATPEVETALEEHDNESSPQKTPLSWIPSPFFSRHCRRASASRHSLLQAWSLPSWKVLDSFPRNKRIGSRIFCRLVPIARITKPQIQCDLSAVYE